MTCFDALMDEPPLQIRWLGAPLWWALIDTEAGTMLSCHRALVLAEAARVAEVFRRENES